MAQTNHPDKQAVRSWMQQRQVQRTPPPSPEETRRQLDWKLVEAERAAVPQRR